MSCVNSISCAPADNTTALSPQEASASSVSVEATQVRVSQAQTSDMTMVTMGGDTVTWSSTRSAELSFTTYNAQGRVGDSSATISGALTELHRTTACSITVEGDLNKEELKDIRSAIRTMQKAAKDVLKGYDEKAAARMANLADLDQFASIDADLEFMRQISVTPAYASPDTMAASEPGEMSEATRAEIPAPTSDS